ncbi:MAG TPA: DUF881 domain-containing protein [Beutenbergiaceae bacterium]|nr:DUF881 domain-containing protein [Beutenbergiaceae bacterium]
MTSPDQQDNHREADGDHQPGGHEERTPDRAPVRREQEQPIPRQPAEEAGEGGSDDRGAPQPVSHQEGAAGEAAVANEPGEGSTTAKDPGEDSTAAKDPGEDSTTAKDPGEDPEEAQVRSPEDPRGKPSRKPISTRSQVLIALLCAVLGFGIAIQVRQTQDDEFAALRQDDLVRLLDEVTQRNDDLVDERDQLLRDRSALRSGSDAQRLAAEYQLVHGVLAGTEPVEGPGVVVTVDNAGQASAQTMVHMLEELRNAGAEAVEVSGHRLVASSAFVDGPDGVAVDGNPIGTQMEWRAIGDPDTMSVALNIPGGALTGFRNAGAVVDLEQRDLVQITAIREVEAPEFAMPVESED